MKLLELFSGKGVISKVARSYGMQTIEVDKRKRTGTCVPDIHIDILKVKNPVALFGKVDIIWASPPCQCWSNAPGTYHFFEGKPQTESTKYLVKAFHKTCEIISEMSPVLYFIENPRGKLRYYKQMIDFLCRTNGMMKEVMYSQYGFQSQKPTNIFTNLHSLKLDNNAKWGRGAKSPGLNINNLTTVQRQEIPRALAHHVISSALHHLLEKKVNHSNVSEINITPCPTSAMKTAL